MEARKRGWVHISGHGTDQYGPFAVVWTSRFRNEERIRQNMHSEQVLCFASASEIRDYAV